MWPVKVGHTAKVKHLILVITLLNSLGWVLLDSAETLFITARDRVFREVQRLFKSFTHSLDYHLPEKLSFKNTKNQL